MLEAHCDAMDAGDYEKAREIRKTIVIFPETAMRMFRVMGKEQLLATEFDLSAANKTFGEGWLDEEPHPRKFR